MLRNSQSSHWFPPRHIHTSLLENISFNRKVGRQSGCYTFRIVLLLEQELNSPVCRHGGDCRSWNGRRGLMLLLNPECIEGSSPFCNTSFPLQGCEQHTVFGQHHLGTSTYTVEKKIWSISYRYATPNQKGLRQYGKMKKK